MSKQLLDKLIAILTEEGSENPVLESQLLSSHLLETNFQNNNQPIINKKHLREHLGMIKNKIPVQRQLGFTVIRNLKFNITNDVLLPGPEMELLIDACLENVKKPNKIVDLCTGSGVIAIILGKKFRQADILATDISIEALKVGQTNKILNEVKNVTFLQGNLFQPLLNLNIKKVDLIVSNPPYCRSDEIIKLPPQISLHTPRIAVDGGSDGLFFHRIIINESKKYLKNDGIIVLENETGQSRILRRLFTDAGYRVIKVYKNAKNEERVIVAKSI
jgi:release factor glutamine methyltransferase